MGDQLRLNVKNKDISQKIILQINGDKRFLELTNAVNKPSKVDFILPFSKQKKRKNLFSSSS